MKPEAAYLWVDGHSSGVWYPIIQQVRDQTGGASILCATSYEDSKVRVKEHVEKYGRSFDAIIVDALLSHDAGEASLERFHGLRALRYAARLGTLRCAIVTAVPEPVVVDALRRFSSSHGAADTAKTADLATAAPRTGAASTTPKPVQSTVVFPGDAGTAVKVHYAVFSKLRLPSRGGIDSLARFLRVTSPEAQS